MATLRWIDMLGRLNKPQYLLQPKAILRRFFSVPRTTSGLKFVRLLWGLPIEVDTGDNTEKEISNCGIIEIPVLEAIFRLTDPTDNFLDVGANIGYMSSAAVAAGAKRIVALEPHPEIFSRLRRNIALWTETQPQIADCIIARQEAVSDKKGMALLRIPSDFSANSGHSTLEAGRGDESYSEVEVPTITLTQVIEQCGEPIGVLKIDIEGHELAVLTASQDSLHRGRVRDIIFEDFEGMNSKVSQLLSRLGYSIFGLNRTPFGPVLLDSITSATWFYASEAYNFSECTRLR